MPPAIIEAETTKDAMVNITQEDVFLVVIALSDIGFSLLEVRLLGSVADA